MGETFARFAGAILGAVLMLGILLVPRSSQAVSANGVRPDLLLNGNFVTGSALAPDHWRTEGWKDSPSVTRYRWTPPSNGRPGEVEVNNLQPNDSRWVQSLTLKSGWFYISAEVRTENVGVGKAGASISLLEDGINSPDLHGTTGWRRVGFYLRVGRHGADVEIGLRVGGFSSLNRGKAYFREARVVAIAAPPPGARPEFDLSAIRRASRSAPIGRPWTLAATFILLAAIALLGWRMYGQATAGVEISGRRGRARNGRRND